MMYDDDFERELLDIPNWAVMNRIEAAIIALQPCLESYFAEEWIRASLIQTLDLLTSVWSELRRDARKLDGTFRDNQLGSLLAITSMCRVVGTCRPEEMPTVVKALSRLVEGWTLSPSEEKPLLPATPPELPEEVNTASPAPETPWEELPIPSEAHTVEQPTEQPQPEPTMEQFLPPEPQSQKPKGTPPEEVLAFSKRLEALAEHLDYIQSHRLPDEETVALLFTSACEYRLLLPQAKLSTRNWEFESLRRQLFQLVHTRWEKWRPPLVCDDISFSEHELQTLSMGYEALVQSWQMWRWYEKEGGVLEKGTAVPLLESIVAPIAMIHQIWSAKQQREKVMERDTTERLYHLVQDAAATRKWKLEMTACNSPRQRQIHYIRQASANWENAKKASEKKQQQSLALEHLRTVIASPNHSSFEEDLLCALVDCHRAQIPYSNRELVELMRGYHFLLENPAVPERCQLTGSAYSAARKYLVSLGKKLVDEEIKRTAEPQPPEELPAETTNGEIIDKARQITKGKRLLMLCFHRSPEVEQKLRESLQLEEVQWPDLHGSESLQSIEAYIRNSDITVVVVPYSRTKWKDARDIAKQYNKMFVMATKGYGTTHVAQQIVEQCGGGVPI